MHTHNRMKAPRYKAILPKTGPLQRLVVKPEVRELYTSKFQTELLITI